MSARTPPQLSGGRAASSRGWSNAFKLSTDPRLEEKVVGLYHNPSGHAAVLCADEKTEIQTLAHSQSSLPMGPGRAQTMTHDNKRHGTTTPFAAMGIATGEVLTAYESETPTPGIAFLLKLIDRTVPDHLGIRLVADDHRTREHDRVTKWLEHPSRRDR